jgi:hypothetical protein
MSGPLDLGDPTAVLLEVARAFRAAGIRAAAYGGLALSTRDLDLEDAASVVRVLGAQLDLSEIARQATMLASEIPDHDVRGRLQRALARKAGPGK